MFCTKCGEKAVYENQKFCRICGNKLDQVISPVNQAPVAPRPVMQQPVSPRPVIQQPVMQQPVMQQPVTPRPMIQQPVAPRPMMQQPVNQQLSKNPVPVKSGKKKSKVKILLPLLLFMLILIGIAASLVIFNPNVKKIIFDLKGMIMKESSIDSSAGNFAENLCNGGLFADTGEWVFYANPDLGGSLCAILEESEAPIQLTDFPVANINVYKNTLVFTDISGSYFIETDAEGYKNFSIPDGQETINELLTLGEEKNIMFGGTLYSITGLNSFYENGDTQELAINELDTQGSPAYSVSLIEGMLEYLYFSIEETKQTKETNTESYYTTEVSFDQTVKIINLSADDIEDDLTKYGEIYRCQGQDTISARDRVDEINYWWSSIKDSVSQKTDSWCKDFKVFQDDTVVTSKGGSMIIGTRVEDSDSDDGFDVEKVREIKGLEGWDVFNEKLIEVNGVSYIQVYKNTVSDDGELSSEIQIAAIDKQTGETINTYPRDYQNDMTVKGDTIYFKGEDGFLYEINDGQPAKAISAMAIDKYEILYNGDIVIGYNQGNGVFSEAVLSKNAYDEEAYDLKRSPDGRTYLEDSGWYTHTDRTRFEKILPIHTYRNYYRTNSDSTKMELYKDKNGIYGWYRVNWDNTSEKVKNMSLPPEAKRQNDEVSAANETANEEIAEEVEDEEITFEDETESMDQEEDSAVEEESAEANLGTSDIPIAGEWVREDGKYTLTITPMGVTDFNAGVDNPEKWFYITVKENDEVVAEGDGFVPNVWLREGMSSILSVTESGDGLEVEDYYETISGMYYRP